MIILHSASVYAPPFFRGCSLPTCFIVIHVQIPRVLLCGFLLRRRPAHFYICRCGANSPLIYIITPHFGGVTSTIFLSHIRVNGGRFQAPPLQHGSPRKYTPKTPCLKSTFFLLVNRSLLNSTGKKGIGLPQPQCGLPGHNTQRQFC